MYLPERIAKLLLGHLKQELNGEERAELNEWIENSEGNRRLFDQLNDKKYFLEALRNFEREKAVHRMISDAVELQPRPVSLARRPLFSFIAAAMLILIAGTATWYHLHTKSIQNNDRKKNLAAAQDIMPGRDKATLTLSDGSVLNLDSVSNGTIAAEGKSNISKVSNKLLTYQFTDGNDQVRTTLPTYNSVSTPRGGQYQIVLADGTKVYLNAESSVRFPTSFTSHERQVELTGEAFFEVAKNPKMPFKVKVNDIQVTVLGTHFNVNGYANELLTTTTLLEGSVKIEATNGNISVKLKPGEQAKYRRGSMSLVENPDLENATAWKDGVFRFNKTDIETIMRQVARWYNVEIVYGEKVQHLFSGRISRDVPVSKLLQLLEMTDRVHFTIEDQKIIVRP